MNFSKEYCRELSQQVEEFLQEKFKDEGITVTRKGGTFSPYTYTLKIEFGVTSEEGETQAEVDYRTYQSLYRLPEEMLNAEVSYGTKVFKVTGFLPNCRKNNLQLSDVKTGKTFVAPHTQVVQSYKYSKEKENK